MIYAASSRGKFNKPMIWSQGQFEPETLILQYLLRQTEISAPCAHTGSLLNIDYPIENTRFPKITKLKGKI